MLGHARNVRFEFFPMSGVRIVLKHLIRQVELQNFSIPAHALHYCPPIVQYPRATVLTCAQELTGRAEAESLFRHVLCYFTGWQRLKTLWQSSEKAESDVDPASNR
ncbi:Uncharacterized protein HZ326_17556 [Fusarium oxysporum f. sp. albedinis]|nr:Uncharacterized protein HZ326_17556 [Fusarium oxysporum f. sp. albedinis]